MQEDANEVTRSCDLSLGLSRLQGISLLADAIVSGLVRVSKQQRQHRTLSTKGFELETGFRDLDKPFSFHSDMSTAHSPDSRRTTGEMRPIQTNKVPFTPEFTKMLTKSSARFGALSHHSFFSRHNPHPNRVKHIQGLNGRPVCTVRDDWFVTSSLFPHPLLKSHMFRRAPEQSFDFPLAQSLYGVSGSKNKSALFSEAWRDELKELAAKVNLTSQTKKEKKEDQPVEELVRRKTQYSAATGRIIPPATRSRRSHSHPLAYPQPFHDQELMVLELLCQILQTDSLSTVQQWLLLSGQREKDLKTTKNELVQNEPDFKAMINQRGLEMQKSLRSTQELRIKTVHFGTQRVDLIFFMLRIISRFPY
ncbi:hypothetical protein Q5P01_023449 [Channa striata]|uniref:Thymus, brain and testes associated n=1 Tax=Channa striata TaxID=64152 RepID=A0AA88LNV9_CHASR|nr:hypothetical protein Q5P01_023449 [Channa striata]